MGRGFRRMGGWQLAELPPTGDLEGWLAGRLPEGWFVAPVEVTVDRDEIVVVGTIPPPYPAGGAGGAGEASAAAGEAGSSEAGSSEGGSSEGGSAEGGAGGLAPEQRAAAEAGRITRFREETRQERIGIAQEAEARYRRKVSWGVRCGGTSELFTTYSAPVMSRLRQPQRQVLDTLVDAGVARSRSEALAWCVRLVGEHADTWLAELRQAMEEVDQLRSRGPRL